MATSVFGDQQYVRSKMKVNRAFRFLRWLPRGFLWKSRIAHPLNAYLPFQREVQRFQFRLSTFVSASHHDLNIDRRDWRDFGYMRAVYEGSDAQHDQVVNYFVRIF